MAKKILVVDDESSIREALSKVLHAEDYEVVSAEDGQQAIEQFEAEKIDLLLLDLGLPVKDGWDTLKWLAEVNPLLPVVIITGRWQQRELAEKAGADALMDKPLNVPRLLQAIRELLNEPADRRLQRAQPCAGLSLRAVRPCAVPRRVERAFHHALPVSRTKENLTP